ncbi:class E sortase [Haloactinomyces albus]|uniref:Sortase (Surface protein transpeptidase) n=1 Tax=Haloactinomyces albus TaxID=1352928 RepID=A0AAE3ZBR2_9ACTN|nr:class E sortase [Haloactinomyces albus]MDR7301998.1 sortase (surface protein transpeptidase) [Haloactinomyces albus]
MGSPESPAAPPGRRGERVRSATRVVGEVVMTLGIVILLFVVYEVYVTNWFSARKQTEATKRLHHRWENTPPRQSPEKPKAGRGFAQLYIPSFGPDYRYTIMQGTDQDTLATGPGHYMDTALPGERGNFAVAGHRIGRGAPFGDLNLLDSCDALVVETASQWYVYRVLPMRDEVAGWASRGGDPSPGAETPDPAPPADGAAQRCTGVAPIGGPYRGVVGRRIVQPDRGEVILPVPGKPDAGVPPERRTRLITLTTCHPRFSAEKRLIVHGVLTKRYPKVPSRPQLRPPELEQSEQGEE